MDLVSMTCLFDPSLFMPHASPLHSVTTFISLVILFDSCELLHFVRRISVLRAFDWLCGRWRKNHLVCLRLFTRSGVYVNNFTQRTYFSQCRCHL